MPPKPTLYLDAFKAALDLMAAHVAQQRHADLDTAAARIARRLVTNCREIKNVAPDLDDAGAGD